MRAQPIDIEQLAIQPVDTSSPVPLYHQVEDHLRQMIQSGYLRPLEVLPPELELCEHYQVGRHTIRTALARLVNDKLIARKAGLGTYVLPQDQRTQFYLNRSFTRQIIDMGMTPRSEVIALTLGVIDRSTPALLRAQAGSGCLLLTRLRLGDDTPMSLQHTTVLTQYCPGIERFDFASASLYDVLINQYNLVIKRITHTVNAVAATPDQAARLQVDTGTPLLLVKSNCFISARDVVEHTVSYYRTDLYEYTTVHEFGL